MHVTIRNARSSDASTIVELIKALAIYEREPQAVETKASMLEQQLASDDPPFECLLAEQDGTALGFALFFRNYSTWLGRPGLWLEDLFVRPEYRRQGVARRLLEELARIVIARGWGRMEWSVLDWNELAIDFYRGLDATPMTEWTTYRLSGAALEKLAR